MVTRDDAKKIGFKLAGISEEEVEEQKKVYNLNKMISNFFSKLDLANQILNVQPLYYDKSKNWWIWNDEMYKWELSDETDIMNFVKILSSANTVNSKEKNEILEALKQEARLKKPLDIKPTWIQFKDIIVDIQTGHRFKADPKYFVTNPISYQLHPDNYELTPTMDKIFEEWVGKDNTKLLYEIIAYCMLPSYPIHRLFCLIGSGLNGKSSFLSLMQKFIGKENICSTELDTLMSSRFEITKLHKKLVCVMGETNFSEISHTSKLKKLTGQDLIGFEYKNKLPFDDYNYAKILIATNNLPTTTDKTMGFYRRWTIVDFPNEFSEKKDILAQIPEEEYESLALKCTIILKELLEKRSFYNEGSIKDRAVKYESKSDFLQHFIQEFTEECFDGYITVADFNKKFNAWCKENRHRELSESSIGKRLKELGFEQERKYFAWLFEGKGGQIRVWIGRKWRD